MIMDEYRHFPDFPFEGYFQSVNQYISVQKYWFEVLRSIPEFNESDWHAVERHDDLSDDMYIGLLTYLESISERKVIKLYATSIAGWANFLWKEDSSTRISIMNFSNEIEIDVVEPSELVRSEEDALIKSAENFTLTHGFEAGVDVIEIYDENAERTSDHPYVKGEELSIISSISSENESRALLALKLFLQSGPAFDRVNGIFVKD